MSKREETTGTRISPRALQRKLSSVSKQRAAQEEFVSSSKMRLDTMEDMYPSKGSRTERSTSSDDLNIFGRYSEVVKQLKVLYQTFKDFANEKDKDIEDKLVGILREDKEEDPLHILKCMAYMLQIMNKSAPRDNNKDESTLSSNDQPKNDYELLLQKAENDIRQHIRIEQQLKLLIDNMQAKLDEYEKEEEDNKKIKSKETKVDHVKHQEALKHKDDEITKLQKMLKQKDDSIRAYEEKLISMTILEHKIRSLKESHKKDKENIRNYYEQEFANLTKESQHIQRVLAIKLSTEDKVNLLQEELLSYNDFNLKKVQMIENRLKQLDNNNDSLDRDDPGFVMQTDPGFDDRRYSVRPATSNGAKTSRYDLNSHRCTTEAHPKNSENRNTFMKQDSSRKRDIISELKANPLLRTRPMSKDNVKVEQPQQSSGKSTKDVENYFNYLKKRLDNLHQGAGEKEKEHLRSFDARRSSSVKRGAYLTGATAIRRDKSSEKVQKTDISKGPEDKSDLLSFERTANTKSVPKLRPATNTIHIKNFKH